MKSQLLKLIQNNIGKPRNFQVRAEADEATIYLYDVIGGWWGGVAAEEFVKALKAITAPLIHLRINSPGGDVFDARAIATAIAQHPAKVVAHIDGLAASAATYVAIAANRVEMAQGGFFMVHRSWTLAIGNTFDMRDAGELLQKIDDSLIRDYARKTGRDDGVIVDWMNEETWFSADEAKAAGFVDDVVEAESKAASTWDLGAYRNAPAALTEAAAAAEDEREYDRQAVLRRLSIAQL